MPSATCPHPHDVITSTISCLANITITPADQRNDEYSSSPLARLSGPSEKSARAVMLTLHFLFPHELLPALDLLDRGLVNRFLVDGSQSPQDEGEVGTEGRLSSASPGCVSPAITKTARTAHEVFYVQSASAVTDNNKASSSSRSSGRFRRAYNPSSMHYEVRLDAWNCSCPAFAYSAFGGLGLDDVHGDQPEIGEVGGDDEKNRVKTEGEWRFGGLLTNEERGAPVCKHILAAALGRAAPNLFSGGVNTRMVTAVELAGWAGGWGE